MGAAVGFIEAFWKLTGKLRHAAHRIWLRLRKEMPEIAVAKARCCELSASLREAIPWPWTGEIGRALICFLREIGHAQTRLAVEGALSASSADGGNGLLGTSMQVIGGWFDPDEQHVPFDMFT